MAGFFALSLLWPTLAMAAGGGHGEGIPYKAIIFAAINFILLALILGYFLRGPVKEFFASRAVLIEKNIKESEQLKLSAQQKFTEYDERLKNIAAESQALVNELKKDGELESERILENAKKQAQALKENSERMMDQELKRAKEELKRESVELAAQMAEDLLKKNLKSEDQQRLVSDYLKKMESV